MPDAAYTKDNRAAAPPGDRDLDRYRRDNALISVTLSSTDLRLKS